MKFIPPSEAEKPAGHFSKAQMQREVARQAAIEKQLARYIRLSCGHMTDLETQQQYAVFRPLKGHPMYCEQCYKWVSAERPAQPPVPPDTPLF